MKLALKRKKGFTLLEIIIVVIIVGVLASLALPRLFSTVEYSRSTEAMASMGSIRGSMERCSLKSGTGSYANCSSFTTQLDIANPGLEPGTHFTYAITPNAAVGYTIVATRNSVDGGGATSKITITKTAAAITKVGATAFSKL